MEAGGPRPAGSHAEARAFDLIREELRTIESSRSKVGDDGLDIDIVEHSHSGQFPLHVGGDTRHEQLMVYGDLASLAIRIRSRDDDVPPEGKGRARSAMLVSVHVDSVHTSPGGSDNAASAAVAVELVRNVVADADALFGVGLRGTETSRVKPGLAGTEESRPDPTSARGALIVMFSTGEEDGLVGAHGLVTTHPWFPQVGFAVNLEAMGNGGPHRMFQATPGVLTSRFLRMWSEASRKPSGTVVASDVFAAGLIASDTDHRIFRDFGDVPGIDFAWVENTQAYHTPRDTLALVRPGTIQASGDNLLGFVRRFTRDPPRMTGHLGGGVSKLRAPGRYGKRQQGNAYMWFNPPHASSYVMLPVPDDGVKRPMYAAAIFLVFQIVRGAFHTKTVPSVRDIVHVCVTVPLAVVGCGVAVFAGPIVAAVVAPETARMAFGSPAPWASSLPLLVCISTIPGAIASICGFRAVFTILRRMKKGALREIADAKTGRRKKDDDANKHEDGDGLTAAAHVTADDTGEWVLLAGTTAVFVLMAAKGIGAGVASVYVVLLPAISLFFLLARPAFGVFFSPKRTGLGTAPPSPTAVASALAVPLYVFFPVYCVLLNVMHGMSGRTRVPKSSAVSAAFSEYTNDAVCGLVAGSLCTFLSPMFASVARRSDVFRSILAGLLATWMFAVAAMALVNSAAFTGVVVSPGGQWTASYPQQIVLTTVVRAGVPSSARVVMIPVGPGSIQPLADVIAKGAKAKVPGLKVTCDDDVTIDFATFGTESQGACVVTSDELTAGVGLGTNPFVEPTLTVGSMVEVPGVDGSAGVELRTAIPVELRLGGAGRWAIGVDRACARRVAVVPGTAGDVPRTPPPVKDEAWRLTMFGGGAGRGTGRSRYSVFGAGGADPEMNYTIWLELRGGSSGACVDAVVARADRDLETATARAVREAMPTWAQTFAKMHTPLKLAHVVSVDV